MSSHIVRFVKRDVRKDLFIDSVGVAWSGALVGSVLAGTSYVELPCEVVLTDEQWETYCRARDRLGFGEVMK